MTLDAGNGIRLTGIRRSDKDALVGLLNNRAIYRTTLRIPHPYTGDNFESWYARHEEKVAQQNEQETYWAIRDSHDQPIGGIGLSFSDGQAHRAEIGYWLGEPFWSKGIMTAAVGSLCRHSFEELGLAKITAHVFSFNAASARVVEKCGFELEGYLKRHFLKDGEYIDAKAYGLVR